MLYWNQVWKYLHNSTDKNIEKMAVSEIITYFENQIDKIIKQSERELENINLLREIQGLPPIKRITRTCIKKAINSINSKTYPPLSKKTGGNKKEGEKIEKQTQKKQYKKGVEIK